MKNFCLLAIFLSFTALADDNFLEMGSTNFTTKKSNFEWSLGFENVPYESHFEFNGKTNKIKDKSIENITTHMLRLGRDYNFGGVIIGLQAAGIFGYTDNHRVGKAAQDIDLDIQTKRSNNKMYGMEVGAKLVLAKAEIAGLSFEPFVDFNAGRGRAYLEKDYAFKGNNTVGSELYHARSKDDYNYTRYGLGFSVISRRGVFSFFEVNRNNFYLSEREIKGNSRVNGGKTEGFNKSSKDLKDYSVSTGMIGFGLYF